MDIFHILYKDKSISFPIFYISRFRFFDFLLSIRYLLYSAVPPFVSAAFHFLIVLTYRISPIPGRNTMCSSVPEMRITRRSAPGIQFVVVMTETDLCLLLRLPEKIPALSVKILPVQSLHR